MRLKKGSLSLKQIALMMGITILILAIGISIILTAPFQPGNYKSKLPSLQEQGFFPPIAASPPPAIVMRPENQAMPTPAQTRALVANPAVLSPEMERILQRGELIVALRQKDNPPFFREAGNGQLTGLDIEIAQTLADYLGVSVRFDRQGRTFEEVLDRVYQGKADLAVSKISQSLTRARKVQFSQPYVEMQQGLLVNRLKYAQLLQSQGNSSTPDLSQLTGKIGAIKGSLYVSFVRRRFPRAELVEYADWAGLVQGVMRGEVLAACRDELEIKQVLLTQPQANLEMQSLVLDGTSDRIAIALPWQSSHLLNFVNQYLETVNLHFTADSLLNRTIAQKPD